MNLSLLCHNLVSSYAVGAKALNWSEICFHSPWNHPVNPKGLWRQQVRLSIPISNCSWLTFGYSVRFVFSVIQQLPLMYSSNPPYVRKLASFLDFNFDLCNYGWSFQGFNLPMMCSNNPPYGLKWISFLDFNFDLCNYGWRFQGFNLPIKCSNNPPVDWNGHHSSSPTLQHTMAEPRMRRNPRSLRSNDQWLLLRLQLIQQLPSQKRRKPKRTRNLRSNSLSQKVWFHQTKHANLI